MATSKTARRPKLEGLKGSSTIPSAIRDALNIPNGVLVAPFKELSNVKRLINDYLLNQICPDDSKVLHDIIISALDDISKLVIKEVKNPDKEASTKIIMINGECIIVRQPLIMARYCTKIKSYLENMQISKMFTLEYAKAIKIKRREVEIQNAKANLAHKGQMLMYNAADCSYYEINADLERNKGKRKATTADEEDNENDGLADQKNLDNKDEDDRITEKRLKQKSPADIGENQGMFWVRIEIIICLLTGFRYIISDNHIWRHLPEFGFLNRQPLYCVRY